MSEGETLHWPQQAAVKRCLPTPWRTVAHRHTLLDGRWTIPGTDLTACNYRDPLHLVPVLKLRGREALCQQIALGYPTVLPLFANDGRALVESGQQQCPLELRVQIKLNLLYLL